VIAAFILFLAQVADAVPALGASAEEEREIVVTARKLGRWSGNWEPHNGSPTCKTTTTSGDTEIDQIGCNAMIYCTPIYQAEMDAVVKAATAQGRLKSRADVIKMSRLPVYRAMSKCVDQRRKLGIRELVRKRRAMR
jgi:hypothetical protein